MSDTDLNSFVSVFADLQPWQKEFIEKITKMDFAAIERRLLAHTIRPRGKADEMFIACDWADGIDHAAVISGVVKGGVVFIIDDFKGHPDQLDPVKVKAITDLYLEDDIPVLCTPYRKESTVDGFFRDLTVLDLKVGEIGHLEGFRFIESPIKEDVPLPEEHMHARRTKGKKKPLPFYHGNRRRF